MSNKRNNPPRLSVEIPRELNDRINRHIKWGFKKHLVIALIESTLDLIEQHPEKKKEIIGAIVAKKINLSDQIT